MLLIITACLTMYNRYLIFMLTDKRRLRGHQLQLKRDIIADAMIRDWKIPYTVANGTAWRIPEKYCRAIVAALGRR